MHLLQKRKVLPLAQIIIKEKYLAVPHIPTCRNAIFGFSAIFIQPASVYTSSLCWLLIIITLIIEHTSWSELDEQKINKRL